LRSKEHVATVCLLAVVGGVLTFAAWPLFTSNDYECPTVSDIKRGKWSSKNIFCVRGYLTADEGSVIVLSDNPVSVQGYSGAAHLRNRADSLRVRFVPNRQAVLTDSGISNLTGSERIELMASYDDGAKTLNAASLKLLP